MLADEIFTLKDLRPGDIGFGPIGGGVGLGVRMALAIADGGAPFQHVYMITANNNPGTNSAFVMAVEAMPHGAREVAITGRWTRQYCYVRPDYQNDSQAWMVAQTARKLVGTPYSYADYLALAAHHLNIPVPHLDKYITSSKHMICSQLVDYCLTVNGWHVFDDGRLSQDVTPSALYNELTRRRPRLQFAYPN
jgi:uncharacterized protein YycO